MPKKIVAAMLTVAQSKLMIEALGSLGVVGTSVRVVLVNRGGSSLQLTWGQLEEQFGTAPAFTLSPAAELAYRAAEVHKPLVEAFPASLIAEQFTELAQLLVA